MSDSPSRAVMRFGTDEVPPETRLLTAGPLSVELDGGNLRYVRIGGREAIRAISYVVRDRFWGTYAPVLTDLEVREDADGFRVSYAATCSGTNESFSYSAVIEGRADGRLTFSATGAGDTDFLTNRTGFVVLHGVDGIAGEAVTVEHVDGKTAETTFPRVIDPAQPIMNIRALTHTVATGLRCRCEMTGDTFEMEDQRNWTDASYKTYVRPLGLPHPYTLPAGEAFDQAVALSFEGTLPTAATAGGAEVSVAVGTTAGSLPEIGLWTEPHLLGTALDAGLDGLSAPFVSLWLDLTTDDAADAMAGLGRVAAALDARAALEVVVPDDTVEASLTALAEAARTAGVSVSELAVGLASDMGFIMPGTEFPDTDAFEALYQTTHDAFPDARVGGGNFVYFTELNRKSIPSGEVDYLVHGTTALVHAADDRSVTETLECLPSVIASVRDRYGTKPYRISPAGIGSRTSPFGNAPPANPDAERMTMTREDPRQRGLLGAAWHLGFAARAAEGSVDSLCLGAPTGPFGLIHTAASHAQPWYDDHPGGLFPVWHVMRALLPASGAARRAAVSTVPRDVQALAHDGPDGPVLWLANLCGDARSVTVTGFDVTAADVIDETTFAALAQDRTGLTATRRPSGQTVTLAPYATVRLT